MFLWTRKVIVTSFFREEFMIKNSWLIINYLTIHIQLEA